MNHWNTSALRNWVVYELISNGKVLERDYDVIDYVELLARNPVTEGSGPVWEAHSRGKRVSLRVLDQNLTEEEASKLVEGLRAGPALVPAEVLLAGW